MHLKLFLVLKVFNLNLIIHITVKTFIIVIKKSNFFLVQTAFTHYNRKNVNKIILFKTFYLIYSSTTLDYFLL